MKRRRRRYRHHTLIIIMPIENEENVTIREANAAYATELARLRWESREEDQANHSEADFLRECEVWIQEALASRRWIMAVAESRPGVLLGCMFLQSVEKVPVPGGRRRAWGYITNSFVRLEQRRHGIGQKLLRFLIEAAQNSGFEFLIVWPSEAAVRFYQREGFLPVARVHLGPDVPVSLLVLRRTARPLHCVSTPPIWRPHVP